MNITFNLRTPLLPGCGLRALLIHASEFSYKVVKKAIPKAEDVGEDRAHAFLRNVLVSFISVERQDCSYLRGVVRSASEDIAGVYKLVKASHIVIYPYAHLSRDLADPDCAITALKMLESTLSNLVGAERVSRAPFGWYKSFTISCYGHPLSELSRSYSPAQALQTLTCMYGLNIEKYLKKARLSAGVARTLKDFSKRFGLSSDALIGSSSTMAGLVFKNSLLALSKGLNLGGVENIDFLEVFEVPSIESLLIEIPLRVSLAERVSEALLNNKACVASNVSIKLGFKDGLLDGGYERAHLLIMRGEEEWVKARTVLKNLISVLLGGSELMELHVSVQAPSNASDDLTNSELKLRCVARDLPSLKSAEAVIYIAHVDSLYVPVSAAVLTRSTEGSVSVSLYVPAPLRRFLTTALIKAAAAMLRGGVPTLHTCITPVQAYIIPVGKAHLSYALEVSEKLRNHGIRVVVDSEDGSLGRRIRRAGKLWVPYIVVVGDREVGTGTVNVRIRKSKLQVSMSADELVSTILKDVEECFKVGNNATDERCRAEK